MGGIQMILMIVGVVLVALVAIGMIFATLYRRSSKEQAFVRTGMGGGKVIMDGGALVFPVFHEIIPVNMNTLRLAAERFKHDALITKDRMRVDVRAEFYVRVRKTAEAVSTAAQTLGDRTMNPERLKELIEGKFVDALRAVAAEMTMEELHESRADFVQKVQTLVMEDLGKNGLELETVSLTGLDQTSKEFFNPDNAFDAAGLTMLTDQIESRRKQRNDIERDTQVAIEKKDLEAERLSLNISRDSEYARLDQQREVETRKAHQQAGIAQEQAEQERSAEEARITSTQQVDLARIASEQEVDGQRIAKELAIEEKNIGRQKAIESANIEREKAVKLSDQERNIEISSKSRQELDAQAEAEKARAGTVAAEEQVATARATEVANRDKEIELIEAHREAERKAIGVRVEAEAEKSAAQDRADAVRTQAEAEADRVRIKAQADEERYRVEAEGQEALNEAQNKLSAEIIGMKVKLAVVENADKIIGAAVRPMEKIDGIKIFQLDGMGGVGGGHASGNGGGTPQSGGGNLADQAVGAALRYRMQQPFVDSIIKELGLDFGNYPKLTESLLETVGAKKEELEEETGEQEREGEAEKNQGTEPGS